MVVHMEQRIADANALDVFVATAHRITYCHLVTIDRWDRPRSRVVHPLWAITDDAIVGWVGTRPTPLKVAHLQHSRFVSCAYYGATHDLAVAECAAEWVDDVEERARVWDRFKRAPAPVGYDPAIIPPWSGGPTSPAFAVIQLEPWRLRLMPGSVMMGGGGAVLSWRA